MRQLFTWFVCGGCLLVLGCSPPEISPADKGEAEKDTTVLEDSIVEQEGKILQRLDQTTGVRTKTIWHNPRIIISQLGTGLEHKVVGNIGAGPYGYFSFQLADEVKKLIAIDIDPEAIRFIDSMKHILLPPSLHNQLETRLVEPDDPKIKPGEVDIVTIMNTYAYLPNRVKYLKDLKPGFTANGRLFIVDFKMRRLPIGPPQSEKVPLYQLEHELEEAGYEILLVDDRILDFQYMVLARPL